MNQRLALSSLLVLSLAAGALAGCTGTATGGAGVLVGNRSNPGVPPADGGGSQPGPPPGGVTFPVGTVPVLQSQANPLQVLFSSSCADVIFTRGFNLGANNGAITRARLDSVDGFSESDPSSPQTLTFTVAGAPSQLTSPTGLVEGTHPLTGQRILVACDGFGTANGRVLVITSDCGFNGSATAIDLGALATSRPLNPLGLDFDGRYVWWTEYVGGVQGKVVRADLGQDPVVVEDYMVGMAFPAGVDSNGQFVAIAHSGAANCVVGPAIPPPPGGAPVLLPLPPEDGPATRVLTATVGDPVMLRPYEVRWTANNTLVVLDGFGLTAGGGPGSAGPGNGNLRFHTGPDGSGAFTNPNLAHIAGGLNDPTGLTVIFDGSADPAEQRIDVAFAQNQVADGNLTRVGFSTQAPFTQAVNQVLVANLLRPYSTALMNDGGLPFAARPTQFTLFFSNGYDLGVNNGAIVRHTATF